MRSRPMPAFAAISSRIGRFAVVHHDGWHAMLGGDPRHVGIALQTPHVVEDRGTLFERPGGDPGLDGIDRNREPEFDHGPQHGAEAGKLIIERDRLCPHIGPGRLRSDVEKIRAVALHAPRLRERGVGIDETAAIGERIRRDVEDAHHQRAAFAEQADEEIRIPRGGMRQRHCAALRRRCNGVKRSC